MPARALPARPWWVFRLGLSLGQTSDHARQDSLPRGLRDIHSGHEDDSPRKHFHAISRKCVAICVAARHDLLISRVKPRLFGSCPRHFTPARPSWPGRAFSFMGRGLPPLLADALPSMACAGCFLRGILPRASCGT